MRGTLFVEDPRRRGAGSRWWTRSVAVVGALATLAGCGRTATPPAARDGGPGAGRAAPGVAAATGGPAGAGPSSPASAPSPAPGPATVWRALLGDAARADLDDGGLVIDLGSADQHKFTRGGWLSGWGAPRVDPAGPSHADVTAAVARLGALVPGDRAPTAIWVRARSTVVGQRLDVAVDGAPLGGGEVGPAWGWVKVPVPAPGLAPGWRELELRCGAGIGVRAQVDLVWLRVAGDEPLAIPRAMTLKLGAATRRTLAVPRPRSYAFYLELPRDARLRFEHGARGPMSFFVRAQADGAAPRELWRAAATAGEWRRAEIDLGAFAGQVVRLELGAAGDGGPGGFAEPEIVVPLASAPAPAPARAGRPTPAKNVIVVVMDATRADALRAYEPTSPIATPAFDALVAEGTLFARAYAPANWTRPSVASLTTGLYPATHGVRARNESLAPAIDTLPRRLKAAGFQTALFTTNPHFSPAFGFGQGWDTLRDYLQGQPARVAAEEKTEPGPVFAEALKWVAAHRGKPFLAWVHTMGGHAPYRRREGCTPPVDFAPPPLIRDGMKPAQLTSFNLSVAGPPAGAEQARRWVAALHQGEVACHDRALGEFIAGLRQQGVLDDTLLVVTADHGESLGEHQVLGHGWTLYEGEVRVPLVLRHPGQLARGARVDEIVETLDLFPTILDALGQPAAPRIDGASLLPRARGGAAPGPAYAVFEHTFGYRAAGLRLGSLKLLAVDSELLEPVPRPPAGRRWLPAVTPPGTYLYDLAVDPGETRDRRAVAPIARRYAEGYLGEALAIPAKAQRDTGMAERQRFTAGRAVIDPTLKRQLEALGYLGE